MLLASVLETDGYVVGSNNGSSGFLAYSDGQWHHAGWTNVRAFGVDVEPDTGAILLACGNGLLRSPDNGKSWRVETDWRITEVLDVLPATPTHPTFLATAFGIRRGPSWEPLDRGLSSTYVCRLADVGGGRVLAATESGAALFLPDLDRWLLVGPSVAARSLAVSHHDATPGLWLMGAERGGVLTSRDGGTTWHHDRLGSDSIYAVAIDSTAGADAADGTRLAAGGLSGALWLSDDAGESWRIASRPTTGEPGDGIHALAFVSLDDTGTALLCGCGKSGLLTLDPETGATRSRALDKSFVSRIVLR